jgi:hypothetical protein
MRAGTAAGAEIIRAHVAVIGARATHRFKLTGRRAAIAIDVVAIVALLTGSDDAVPASRDRAIRIAAVAVGQVAVVALFA